MQAQSRSQSPKFQAFQITLVRVALALCAFFPRLVAHVLVQTLQALVLFVVPLCIIAFHSHMHIQMRRLLSPPLSRNFVRRRSADARLAPDDPDSPSSSASSSTRASRSTDTRVSQLRSCALLGPPSPVLRDGERQYRVEGLIDAGAFGRVALATVVGTPSPVLVAIKVYGKDQLGATPRLDAMHDNECRIMSENARRDSIWLVRSRGAFGDAWNRYLVMDYYPNSLARVIFSRDYRPPRSAIRLWVEELALAMYELHDQRIVHCDLKPSNILVTWDGHIAIADFGISLTQNSESHDNEDKPFEQCVFFAYGGTYAYQAPELLIKHARASFTCAVDMWSLGVIIYEMYTGKCLFSPEASGVRNEVWGWDISAIVHHDIDDELARDLVTRLLEVEPDDRLRVTDLGWHPYFSETNWAAVAKRETIQVKLPKSELSSISWEDVLKFERLVVPESGVKHYQHTL
ncbi:kinase-like domain-containing protein [Lactarius sanguifluus]|nr:kinase-like domain-containing protein [Lactarius sanguifluus]